MRAPAVADQFYPANKDELADMISTFLSNVDSKIIDAKLDGVDKLYGGVAPHAGYIYSGQTAAYTYSALERLNKDTDTFILFGPNHTGLGSPVSVSSDKWRTPFGVVEPDLDIIKKIPPLIIDRSEVAHIYEHSIEVQLPFLQYIFGNFKIVPIILGMQDQETVLEVADSILNAISGLNKNITFIASSDFSHYVPEQVAYQKDKKLIDKIENLDVPGLYKVLYEENVSACGYGCISTVMDISKRFGAKVGRFLKYSTSGDVSGDRLQVVGYASIVI
ncbi:MAG: MEMO1 family protein [Candidatus Methanoliparum thermophilum]|uniref:MEMO1 family protein EF806_00960 n=1 Tax=Methanoliparum thermophilum TaxID=2491083 RepID=A0A520KTS6_METT2|nr:MEMO1 family protein [Candidatus Methanoliparum sp. LAM-1]RZN65493.1 MAG: MEMO1 family protein [Candidatus Methanoliparum thermophilum]BDC35412.1 hypothetical protein MTLP_00940 [Candidatus Methanoliparum sp. LAM-1]